MNVLLINPWITDFAAHDFWSRPLGLLYLGAFLGQRGHSVRLLDCMDRFQDGRGYTLSSRCARYGTGNYHRQIIEKPSCLSHIPRHFNRYGIPHELFDAIVGEGVRPDVVCVTCIMTYWYHGAFEAIRRIRRLLPGVPVVLGGIYSTLCADHARSDSGADVVVTHTDPLRAVNEIEHVAGITAEIVDDNRHLHFNEWPDPLWSCYAAMPAAQVMTSRGCPMNCTVCASNVLFKGFERKDPRSSASHIRDLGERGVSDIAFADDALLLDSERYAVPFFEALIADGNAVRLHTPNGLHVREITPELARLMKRAGVVTIRLSLETSNRERQADFSHKVKREDFRRAVKALYEAGYSPKDLGAYILAGMPGQEHGEVLDTIQFAWDAGVTVKPALFSPVPGTVAFDRAVDAGMIRRDGDPVLQNNTLRTTDWFKGGETEYRAFRTRITLGNERVG